MPSVDDFLLTCILPGHLRISSKVNNKLIWVAESIGRLNICDRSDHAVLRGILRAWKMQEFCDFLFVKWS